MHTHSPQGFCYSFGAISWSLFVVRWLRSVMNLLCLLSEDVKKYTMLSLSKACHSNPGAMPPTPISSSGHGTPKASQCSGAGHRSAPATPLAKTTPTSERPSGAGRCTLPATPLKSTAEKYCQECGKGLWRWAPCAARPGSCTKGSGQLH